LLHFFIVVDAAGFLIVDSFPSEWIFDLVEIIIVLLNFIILKFGLFQVYLDLLVNLFVLFLFIIIVCSQGFYY
jgi:hypothetical protein